MSNHNPTTVLSTARALGRDGVFLCLLALQGVIVAFYLLPVIPTDTLQTYGSYYSEMSLIVFTGGVLLWRGLRSVRPRERAFWLLLACAYAAYFGTYTLYFGSDWEARWTPTTSLVEDSLNLLYYVAIYLALVTAPHSIKAWDISQRTRRLELTASVVFVASLVAYFVLIPVSSGLDEYQPYRSYAYTVIVYAVLDALACAGFLLLRRGCRDGYWRTVYTTLAVFSGLWIVLNGVEAAMYVGGILYVSGSGWDLLWLPPYAVVVAAARLPATVATSTVEVHDDAYRERPNRVLGRSLVVVYLAALPVIHFAMNAMNAFDPAKEPAREVCLVVSVLLLAGLSLPIFRYYRAEREMLETRTRQLQRLEAIGRLSGGIGHEFNNLLTIVNGYAELILSDMDPADPARPRVTRIYEAGQHAAALTKRIQKFGREETRELGEGGARS